jgi:hypothetical protein
MIIKKLCSDPNAGEFNIYGWVDPKPEWLKEGKFNTGMIKRKIDYSLYALSASVLNNPTCTK